MPIGNWYELRAVQTLQQMAHEGFLPKDEESYGLIASFFLVILHERPANSSSRIVPTAKVRDSKYR